MRPAGDPTKVRCARGRGGGVERPPAKAFGEEDCGNVSARVRTLPFEVARTPHGLRSHEWLGKRTMYAALSSIGSG